MRFMMRAFMVAIIWAAVSAAGSGGVSAAPIGNSSGDLAAAVKMHTPSLTEPAHHRRHYRRHHHHRRHWHYHRHYYYGYCHWHRHRHHYHWVCHY